MISPSNVMEQLKRVSVGGRLVAFFKAVAIYFVVGGEGGGGGGPSAPAVCAKLAPVLCLLACVLLARASVPLHLVERRAYGALVALGLALSALGDALLEWPQQLEAGLGAFAAAHVAYLAAFGWRARWPKAAPLIYLCTGVYVYHVRAPGLLGALVPAYALLLSTVLARAAARGGAAAGGAALFLLSDAALGYSLFKGPLPYRQVVVMSTYYLGQLGIALSAMPPPAPPARRPRALAAPSSSAPVLPPPAPTEHGVYTQRHTNH